jgi:hypothetical protein
LQVCPQGCPYQQIQAAVDAAHSGNEILVAPGRYHENVVITKSLTISGTASADQVVLEAKEPNKPTVFVWNPATQPAALPLQAKLEKLTITGAHSVASTAVCAQFETGFCSGLYIKSSSVQLATSKGQLSYSNAVHLTLADVQVVRNSYSGIEWKGQVDLVLIRTSTRENFFGIYGSRGSARVALYDSEASDNKGSGVHLNIYDGVLVFSAFDSRFLGNKSEGISTECTDSFLEAPRLHLVLKRVTARDNGNHGIFLEGLASANISDSSIEENQGIGFLRASGDCLAKGTAPLSSSRVRISKNGGPGIWTDAAVYVKNSLISENGQNAQLFASIGGGAGIVLGPLEDLTDEAVQGLLARSVLIDNEIRGNTGFGVLAVHAETLAGCLNNKVSENGLGSYNPAAAEKCK